MAKVDLVVHDCNCKAVFTRYRHLLLLLDEVDMSSRTQISHMQLLKNIFCIKYHFRSHFSSFQINTQLYFARHFFYKMAVGRHFGWPKITFDRISCHFRSIRSFFFEFFIKWPLPAILDDRKSLSIAFLAISNQYTTFLFLKFFYKMAGGGHFGWVKITFDHISCHFRSIRSFFLKFFIKWRPAAILGDRKSLSIAFLAISDQYPNFFFGICFFKMTAGGHFGFRFAKIGYVSGYIKYEVDRCIFD